MMKVYNEIFKRPQISNLCQSLRCSQNCLKKEDPKTEKTAASRSTYNAPSKSKKPSKTVETSIYQIEMTKGKYISIVKRQETIGKV